MAMSRTALLVGVDLEIEQRVGAVLETMGFGLKKADPVEAISLAWSQAVDLAVVDSAGMGTRTLQLCCALKECPELQKLLVLSPGGVPMEPRSNTAEALLPDAYLDPQAPKELIRATLDSLLAEQHPEQRGPVPTSTFCRVGGEAMARWVHGGSHSVLGGSAYHGLLASGDGCIRGARQSWGNSGSYAGAGAVDQRRADAPCDL